MERRNEDIVKNEIGDSSKMWRLPSAWLAFYSCTFLAGGLYLVRLVWAEATSFPILTAFVAATALLAGMLLWFRKRVALPLYVAIAFGILAFAAYRFFAEGYSSSRVGMVVGGLLMLAGYSSVSEELPVAGSTKPLDRGGESDAS